MTPWKVDCHWSSWNIGDCSVSCGGGSLTKTRSKTVEEANGGTCGGQSSDTEICNPNLCPGKDISFSQWRKIILGDLVMLEQTF